MDQSFVQSMISIGIVSTKEQETVWDIVKRCKHVGGTVGAAVGAATATAGSVVVPGVGALPGWFAGALAGYAYGTFACTLANVTFREQLQRLAKGQPLLETNNAR
jgi:hypothetical protein